jgi:hypothetical protein
MKIRLQLFCLLVIIFCFIAAGCNRKEPNASASGFDSLKTKMFSIIPPSQSGIKFINTLTESEQINILTNQYLYNGAGVAIGDLDNDGLPDIFFTGNMVECKLYHNKGNFQFEDITKKSGITTSGWCTGVTMADVNGDGFLDIYVCRSSPFEPEEKRSKLLFINNGNLTFTERAKEYGIDNKGGFTLHANFFDYDRDGNLDLYLVNHGTNFNAKLEPGSEELRRVDPLITHRLYHNNGNGTFTDVSEKAGVITHGQTFGQSATVSDVNNDNWPDIYVCVDFDEPDRLLINNKDGTFTNKIHDAIRHTSKFSMGSDIADMNNDGMPDILTVDMLPEDNYREKILFGPLNYDKQMFFLKYGYGYQFMQNTLQLNNGNGTFSEVAELAGIARTDWSWAILAADFDNSGTKDLYISNGYLRDFTNMDYVMYRAEQKRKEGGVVNRSLKMVLGMPTTRLSNYAYSNNGNLSFSNVSSQWGLDFAGYSNGAAYADLDNDGDLDIVVNNINDTALIYRNNAESKVKNNFLALKFTGYAKNTFGIGAKIKATTGDRAQYYQNYTTRGYESSVDNKMIIGLGSSKQVDTLEITWPDDKMQTLTNVAANQTLSVDHKNAVEVKSKSEAKPSPVFVDAASKHKINYTHKENEFIDFKREPLLTHMYSKNGPGIAVGDVNGDGRDDFFVGGASGSSGMLFLQQANETFVAASSQPWKADAQQEDMGCLFFDSDNDGDLDLYVVSGGSEESGLSTFYQDRLYINDGKGNFKKNASLLPAMTISGSCVAAADFDGDGDLDLFRGSRLIPGVYPYPPKSYILRNDGGHFTDVTTQVCPLLYGAGMVTAGIWSDFNNDGKPDLIVTGEWMPVYFLRNENGRLIPQGDSISAERTRGWWNSITAADFDNDGDMDYAVGNFGLNTRIKATPDKPATVYFKDFDGNNTLDAITCYYFNDGKSYPMCSRDDITDQVRMLKKRLLRFSDYAGKTIDQVFTPDEMKDVKQMHCYTMQSSYFENIGNGVFNIKPLPVSAQMSPVFGTAAQDFDGDGNMDIVLTGNSYATEINSGREDAGNGLFLKGDGKGNFTPMRLQESGWNTPYDGKALACIYIPSSGKWLLLVSNNDGRMQAFETAKAVKPVQTVNAGRDDFKINWTDADGKKHTCEFNYGSGYLASSSRRVAVPKGVDYQITNFRGETQQKHTK